MAMIRLDTIGLPNGFHTTTSDYRGGRWDALSIIRPIPTERSSIVHHWCMVLQCNCKSKMLKNC
eukprot:2825093-Amphidinium_carterae.1